MIACDGRMQRRIATCVRRIRISAGIQQPGNGGRIFIPSSVVQRRSAGCIREIGLGAEANQCGNQRGPARGRRKMQGTLVRLVARVGIGAGINQRSRHGRIAAGHCCPMQGRVSLSRTCLWIGPGSKAIAHLFDSGLLKELSRIPVLAVGFGRQCSGNAPQDDRGGTYHSGKPPQDALVNSIRFHHNSHIAAWLPDSTILLPSSSFAKFILQSACTCVSDARKCIQTKLGEHR